MSFAINTRVALHFLDATAEPTSARQSTLLVKTRETEQNALTRTSFTRFRRVSRVNEQVGVA